MYLRPHHRDKDGKRHTYWSLVETIRTADGPRQRILCHLGELKKGSAELIILSIVEPRARHGYDISKLIESRSAGQLKFHVASLYPLLYRLEERGWLQGRWVEKAGQRRRRFYSLTAEGRRVLTRQRETWKSFVHAMDLITAVDHA